MKEVKISENGRRVLEVLKEVGEPMNCGDLAKELRLINPKSLPGLMNGLVKRGLVTASKRMGKKEKMLRLTEYAVLDVSKHFPNKAGDTQYNEKQEAVLKWCAETLDADATFTSRSLPFKVAPATLTSLVNRGNLAAKPEKKQILVTEEVEQTYYTIAADDAE